MKTVRAADNIASELLQEYLFGGDETHTFSKLRKVFTIESVQDLYKQGLFE